ncbi:alpha/beta fold hydrolase [Streptomyces sp. YKOK-I1]
MSSYSVKDVTVGDHVVRVNRAGEGRPRTVLFLHGSGPGVTALSNWEGALERLGAHFDCVAPDLLGFGHSTHPDPAPPDMTAFTELRVRTLFGLLDALGLDKVDVVGNSMGGMIAMEMALLHPERVDRITLMGTGGIPFTPGPDLARLITFYDDPTAEALADLMRCFLYDPVAFGDLDELSRRRLDLATRPEVRRSHLATFSGGIHAVDQERLASLDHPVMVIHGREDRIIPVEVSQRLLSLLPHAHLHVLGECGHWLQLEKPAEFDWLITGFHGRKGL